MSVRVDTLTTDVTVEPERRPADDARRGTDWDEEAKIAALRARTVRDEMRTRARGYDD
jgi:hypothetical protein